MNSERAKSRHLLSASSHSPDAFFLQAALPGAEASACAAVPLRAAASDSVLAPLICCPRRRKGRHGEKNEIAAYSDKKQTDRNTEHLYAYIGKYTYPTVDVGTSKL